MYGIAQNYRGFWRTLRLPEMNKDRIQGVCMQFLGRINEGWGTLAGDPYRVAEGARERLDGRIQERRGIAQQEAERQLREFLNRNRRWWDHSQE